MPLDIHKSVTFIPCLYMFLKTSWFICMVQSIVDAQNAASGSLSFQTNTNTAQFFLWLSMLLESSLDRVATTQTDLACIFTKPETSTSISLITDSFVVFFYVYDASVALKECASPTAVYVQFFLWCGRWPPFALALLRPSARQSQKPGRSKSYTRWRAVFFSLLSR